MESVKSKRVEFGDFQTPSALAIEVCQYLYASGMRPDYIIEPTCGVGAFVKAAVDVFDTAKKIVGYEINSSYINELDANLLNNPLRNKISINQADFFSTDFEGEIGEFDGEMLVLGNFPWVTNSTQGVIGGQNIPQKSNFLGFKGFDAISGKSNFDISEWMLLDVLGWLVHRGGTIAMLVKSSVARKVMAHCERQKYPVTEAFIIHIDAKAHFNASVDACLFVVKINSKKIASYDYRIFSELSDSRGRMVGHREGLTVSNISDFESNYFLFGKSPQKWRSGIKHDASAVMEFDKNENEGGFNNGAGENYYLEEDYLYPLLKGSDIGSGKEWRKKYVLVTQHRVGEETASIEASAPLTWSYLQAHSEKLKKRGSSIYAKNPEFSIFGVGDYAFRPWKIAICSLYKKLKFRLVAPIDGKPVMFDDTVYYVSFESKEEAENVLSVLESKAATLLFSSLIFWDEKRPIKTGILNSLDWLKL